VLTNYGVLKDQIVEIEIDYDAPDTAEYKEKID
jgi:hypothetical protein